MKIAIIGGGWVGCHLANKYKNTHKITLFEKNNQLFSETSFNNQNRLHLGFHYSRNSKTRNLCINTFNKFISDYGFLTEELSKNLYCVPKKESIIDYETFCQIFLNFETNEVKTNLNDIEGCINTKERFINFKKAKEFFNNSLSDLVVNEFITKEKIKELKKEYDLVINCTNNHIKDEKFKNSFYELTLTLIYEKINLLDFNALTFVDGNLFSIYPYQNNQEFTVTDVEHTPIKKFKSIKSLNSYLNTFNESIIDNKKNLIETKIKKYYINFLKDFKYKRYFISTKSKIVSLSDDRSPIITKNNNYVTCFTGKIQGIYLIEDFLKQEYNL
jgi:hypothetical protein